MGFFRVVLLGLTIIFTLGALIALPLTIVYPARQYVHIDKASDLDEHIEAIVQRSVSPQRACAAGLILCAALFSFFYGMTVGCCSRPRNACSMMTWYLPQIIVSLLVFAALATSGILAIEWSLDEHKFTDTFTSALVLLGIAFFFEVVQCFITRRRSHSESGSSGIDIEMPATPRMPSVMQSKMTYTAKTPRSARGLSSLDPKQNDSDHKAYQTPAQLYASQNRPVSDLINEPASVTREKAKIREREEAAKKKKKNNKSKIRKVGSSIAKKVKKKKKSSQ